MRQVGGGLNSPTEIDSILSHYFILAGSVGTYSFNHRRQKLSIISWLYLNCLYVVLVLSLTNLSGK